MLSALLTRRLWVTGVEIAQLLSGEAAAVVHAARTWAPEDIAAPPSSNIERVPMLEALLADGRARFVGGALSPRLDAVRSPRRASSHLFPGMDGPQNL